MTTKDEKIKLINAIKAELEDGVKSHKTLKLPRSSANKSLKIINKNKNLNSASSEELDQIINEIKSLCEQSRGKRDNPIGNVTFGQSNSVYDNVLKRINTLGSPTESINHASSSPYNLTDEELLELGRKQNEELEKMIHSPTNRKKKSAPTRTLDSSPEFDKPLSKNSYTTDEKGKEKEEEQQVTIQEERTSQGDLPYSSTLSGSPSSGSPSNYYEENDSDDSITETDYTTDTKSTFETEFSPLTDFEPGSYLDDESQDEMDEEDREAEANLEERKNKNRAKVTYPKLKYLTEEQQQQLQESLDKNSSDYRYSPPEFTPISASKDSQNVEQALEEITQNIRRFEAIRYSGPWEYKRFDAEDKTGKNIIVINYFPGEDSKQEAKLHKRHMQQKEKYSNAIRKLSILSGVLTMIDYDDYLTNDSTEKNKIKKEIIDMAREVSNEANNIQDLDSESQGKGKGKGKENEKTTKAQSVNDFTKDLIAKVGNNCPKNRNVTREIREAERYFTAEHNKNIVTVTLTHKGNEVIGQAAVNLNHSRMIPEQKESYIAIHNEDKNMQPQWFRQLTKPQQQWYLKQVPKSLDRKDWNEFESLFKPSAIQDTPGNPNFRGETAFVVNKDEQSVENKVVIISESNKMASPSPYEMPLEDRKTHTRLNVEQAFIVAQESSAESFEALWSKFFTDKNSLPEDFKIPILMNSLLSEDTAVKKADSKLIKAQQAAFLEVQDKQEQEHSNFKWLYCNNGTNAFTTIKGETEDAHRLRDINKTAQGFLSATIDKSLVPQLNTRLAKLPPDNEEDRIANKNLCDKILLDIEKNPKLNDEQKLALKTLTISIFKLREIEGYDSGLVVGSGYRNRSEYIVAVEKLMVEAMGGVTINNCKSGKDRTGASAIYQNAMNLIAYHNEGQIPSIYNKTDLKKNVSKEELKQVNKLLMDFYTAGGILHCSGDASQKAQYNTGGSDGLKLKFAGIVDDGIYEHENFKVNWNTQQRMAATNKSPVFVDDETDKAQRIEKADKYQIKLDKLKAIKNPTKEDTKKTEKTATKLEEQLQKIKNQEKVPSRTDKLSSHFRAQQSKKKSSKTSLINKEDFIKQTILSSDRSNIPPELNTFIDLCVTLKSDYKFINKGQGCVSEKTNKLNSVNNHEYSTRQQSVALILKVISTPKSSNVKFGETKALKQFMDKYNSQSNEIPDEIKEDIQDILEIKPDQKLSQKHIKSKKDELQSFNLEVIDSTVKKDFKSNHLK